MPTRRVTTVTLPVDPRSAIAFETYTGHTPLLAIMAPRPGLLVTLTLPDYRTGQLQTAFPSPITSQWQLGSVTVQGP